MKWVLIPALGADHRLFSNMLDLLPDLQILRFDTPRQDETIEHYAHRLSEQIDGPGPFILGGASFGGMLSSILCQELKPAALVLMSSSPYPRALRQAISVFEWMSRVVPETLARWLGELGSHPMGWLEPISRMHAEQFTAMVRETDLSLIRRSGRMIMGWQAPPRITVPVFHLHGADDKLIPAHSVQPTHVVEGAGHLLNLTHSDAVRTFIREVCGQMQRR